MTGTPKCTTLPTPVGRTAAVLFTLLAATLLLAPAATAGEAAPAPDDGCAAAAADLTLAFDAPASTPAAEGSTAACVGDDFLCGGCPRFTVCAATAAYWQEGGGPLDPPILCCGQSFACLPSCKKSCSLACAIE